MCPEIYMAKQAGDRQKDCSWLCRDAQLYTQLSGSRYLHWHV